MSEAEKSAEIEDVLSSIRRLVADGPRANANKAQPLNLAASRVEPPLTAPTDIDEAMEELPVEEDIILETPSFVPEEDTIIPIEDVIAPLPDIETPAPDAPISFVQAINASIAEISKNHDIDAVEDETPAPIQDTVEENVAPLEDVDIDERAAHVNAFLANETALPSEPVQHEPAKPAPFVLRADMVAADVQAPHIPEPTVPEAVVETPQDDTPFQDIPDDTLAELDLADADMSDDLDTADEDKLPEETADEAFIDEETLREIVSELVRAELQGDLGDRITRNVRKLVRREIHQALASREIP